MGVKVLYICSNCSGDLKVPNVSCFFLRKQIKRMMKSVKKIKNIIFIYLIIFFLLNE